MFIDLFDEVIAALVVSIDGTFCLADAFGSEVIAASNILFVPEREVFEVVLAGESEDSGFAVFRWREVPCGCPVGVCSEDFLNVHGIYLIG